MNSYLCGQAGTPVRAGSRSIYWDADSMRDAREGTAALAYAEFIYGDQQS